MASVGLYRGPGEMSSVGLYLGEAGERWSVGLYLGLVAVGEYLGLLSPPL